MSSSPTLDNPKSISLIYPYSSITMFSGFKSLYIIYLECKYSIASTIYAIKNLAVNSSNITPLVIYLDKSPFGQ